MTAGVYAVGRTFAEEFATGYAADDFVESRPAAYFTRRA